MGIDKYIVQMYLVDIGVPSQLRGFVYITDAIVMAFESDMHVCKPLHKYVYPELALRYGVSACSVERCIRYAVHETINAMTTSVSKQFRTNYKSVTTSSFINSIIKMLLEKVECDPIISCIHSFEVLSKYYDISNSPNGIKLYEELKQDIDDLKTQAALIDTKCIKMMEVLDGKEND